eukprot:7443773-Ditylum_brightwellii.AAC.1
MDPKDAHSYLLNGVKRDQQNTKQIEEETRDIKKQIKKLSIMKDELHKELNENNQDSDSDNAQKAEALFQKDREATEFIEVFN